MRIKWTAYLLLAAGIGATVGCSDESGDCDASTIVSALASASAGDTVRVGDCVVTATLEVPAGVTLSGNGTANSTIVAPAGQAAIELTPGEPTTTIRDLSVETDGTVGVVARGAGNVRIVRVDIAATRGVGLGAEGLDSLTLEDVSTTGPVTSTNVGEFTSGLTSADTATHGIVVLDVGEADFTDVTASGFAQFGAIVMDTTLTWRSGGTPGNLGTGMVISGGAADLRDVNASGTLQGFNLLPAYGAVFTAQADIRTEALIASDSEGVGLLHSGASAEHVDLTVSNNEEAGVWVQRSNAFAISGTASAITGNRLAGVIVIESSNVSIRDGVVSGTRIASRIEGVTEVQVGDGLQLVDTTQNVVIDGMTLDNNERVGLLIDLGGANLSGITVRNITIDGEGDQLGAVAQNGAVAAGWDSGITRSDTIETNDDAFTGDLDIVGLVGPNDIPLPDGLGSNGLDALVGPND